MYLAEILGLQVITINFLI